ncbi:MAG: hypothetical protein HMLKMBBP_01842 [Planctomycetes bacterium]|nr:hypothetical protein [Planctomycetota bacterium]
MPAAAAALREFGRGSDRVAPPERVEPLTRAETEQFRSVVPLALGWLARNQEEDGRWSASRHGGEPGHDVGVTGLAMLAFVGAGNTNASGEHAAAVKKAVSWIVSQQDAEGCIGPRNRQHFIYDHAWASLALVESYALSQSPALKIPAQRAVDFVVRARNPYLGWRYGVRDGDNDTSMTGTMVMVLKSAKLAGLAVDDMAFKGALSWFEKMTDSDTGRTGYITRGGAPARTSTAADRFPPERVETPTAIASVARAFCGLDPATDPVIAKGAALVASKPPVWRDDSVDFHWWYWGTLATFQRGGDEWRTWSARLVRALGPNQQRESGADAGSWTADDPWTAEGGRVYATSMACLAAQIVQRYASAGR